MARRRTRGNIGCNGRSELTVLKGSVAVAAGVPTRQVAGWLYGSSGHVWAEFYREGEGWQQVDPTGGGKLMCGIYHIPYFASEDGEMPIVYVAMPKIETL